MDTTSLADTPDELIRMAVERLHNSSTALIKLSPDPGGKLTANLIGSGTFVTFGQVHGILTAHHVVRGLTGQYSLGLTGAREGEEHNLVVTRENLRICNIAIPETDEYGPDLAFIYLASWNDVCTIKASRSFHPLEHDRQEMLTGPPAADLGIWFACGVPGERVTEVKSEKGFERLLSYQHWCGAGGANRESDRGDWDYVEMDVDNDPARGLPASFGGMSGGGLWQVTVAKTSAGALQPRRALYCGVIFYQRANPDGTRTLRCHGRRTVYDHAFRAVKDGPA